MVRLLRNISPDHVCKYGIIRLDKMRVDGTYDTFMNALQHTPDNVTISELARGYIEIQRIGDPEESFCIKLKDRFAPAAFRMYGRQWENYMSDSRFAQDMYDLAARAEVMPNRKVPD